LQISFFVPFARKSDKETRAYLSNTTMTMKNGRLYILILLHIGLFSTVFGQLEQSSRLEFKVNPSEEEYFDVTTLGRDGLLVTKRDDEYYGDEKWTFYRYNSDLKETWHSDFKLEYELKPIRSFSNNDFLYWYFQESDTDHFEILRLDLHNGETDLYKGDLLTRADISHFKVLNNTAFIGGYHHNRPVVMTFSFFDKSVKTLPYLYNDNTEISNLEIDEQRNELNVLIYGNHRKNCSLTIKTYSYEGKLTRTTTMPHEQGNGLISGKILPIDPANSLLIGNYAQGCTQYSQGLYFARFADGEPEALQKVDFSQLENFFNYLKPKRKQRVLDKITRKKEEGKEPKFRYRLLVHDVIKTANELVLVAEIYYPIYKNSGSYISGGLRNPNREFDGYRFTHAVVCGFDKASGKLLWDNCFAIKDVESLELFETVQVTQQNDRLILAYPRDGKIHTEVIRRNEVVREQEEFDIQSASTEEKVINNEKEQLAAWYDNTFLVFGFQKISAEKFGPTREVFYINKLSYDAFTTRPAPAVTTKSGSGR
jgi:hypothetical protein